MDKKERLSFRLPKALERAVDTAAAADHRSRSNWVEATLAAALINPKATRAGQAHVEADVLRDGVLAFRLSKTLVAKLDKAAEAETRSRSEMCVRLLAGSPAGRAAMAEIKDNVFA